ncbi:hypothetical protein BJ912DRAFT_199310 [Pholiota molesta]|nr:hypothetical protein BJ912DRAFT_199310 [Pholiota molesta]
MRVLSALIRRRRLVLYFRRSCSTRLSLCKGRRGFRRLRWWGTMLSPLLLGIFRVSSASVSAAGDLANDPAMRATPTRSQPAPNSVSLMWTRKYVAVGCGWPWGRSSLALLRSRLSATSARLTVPGAPTGQGHGRSVVSSPVRARRAGILFRFCACLRARGRGRGRARVGAGFGVRGALEKDLGVGVGASARGVWEVRTAAAIAIADCGDARGRGWALFCAIRAISVVGI